MFSSFERIKREYIYLNKNPICSFGFSVGLLHENDYRNWKLTLTGPSDSLYSGGYFSLLAHFPEQYPMIPPQVCF